MGSLWIVLKYVNDCKFCIQSWSDLQDLGEHIDVFFFSVKQGELEINLGAAEAFSFFHCKVHIFL